MLKYVHFNSIFIGRNVATPLFMETNPYKSYGTTEFITLTAKVFTFADDKSGPISTHGAQSCNLFLLACSMTVGSSRALDYIVCKLKSLLPVWGEVRDWQRNGLVNYMGQHVITDSFSNLIFYDSLKRFGKMLYLNTLFYVRKLYFV